LLTLCEAMQKELRIEIKAAQWKAVNQELTGDTDASIDVMAEELAKQCAAGRKENAALKERLADLVEQFKKAQEENETTLQEAETVHQTREFELKEESKSKDELTKDLSHKYMDVAQL
jgi:tryptophanyl-tRNA synthetase